MHPDGRRIHATGGDPGAQTTEERFVFRVVLAVSA